MKETIDFKNNNEKVVEFTGVDNLEFIDDDIIVNKTNGDSVICKDGHLKSVKTGKFETVGMNSVSRIIDHTVVISKD